MKKNTKGTNQEINKIRLISEFLGRLILIGLIVFIGNYLIVMPKLLAQIAKEENPKMDIRKELFGKTEEGKDVYLYTLTNNNGLTVKIMTYGGIVTSLLIPDKKGNMADIVLGFDTLKDYLAGHPYFGALIGRYAGRIARGRFALNGKDYKLATNDGKNHLHGGIVGFDKVIWEATEMIGQEGVGIKLTYLSKDGEEGYPGNLFSTVVYTLTSQNELKINYEAKTDKPTPVNLTHHSYFNLRGAGSGDILNEKLLIVADKYTVVDKDLIPTGEIKNVKGTPLDFTTPHTIGERIKEVEGGYDRYYVLNKKSNELSFAARVCEEESGREVEVYTTEPGLLFYSGNFLDGTLKGKEGKVYQKHYGFCLETQHFPDSPNHPNFPSTILNPGETYRHLTIYKFSVQ